MIYLKKHTPEEFEQMSDEQFEEYTEALCDICTKLGIEICPNLTPYGSEMEMETRVINLIANLKRQNPKMGRKFNNSEAYERKAIGKATKAISDCRTTLIKSIKDYIDDGTLTLGRRLKHDDEYLDAPYLFREICMVRYEDEVEYLCPDEENPYDMHNFIKIEDLSLDNLLKIISMIETNKTTLYTREEGLIRRGHGEQIKDIIRNSGLNIEL